MAAGAVEGIDYREVSRVGSGSPATGSHAIHVQEQDDILNRTARGPRLTRPASDESSGESGRL